MANIASALEGSTHLTAIGDATAHELGQTPTNALLMYLIDQAPENALYYLARQFNVLGWKGWNLATTDQERRTLIKNAITLHRKKGTVFAIKEAVRSVGFENAEVREGVGVEYDGDHNHDGTITYAGGNWATFRVTIFVGGDVEINPQLSADLRALIGEYKNARSHLLDISFHITLSDTLTPSESLEYDDNELVDELLLGSNYDGVISYDGAATHNNGADLVNLRIFQNGILIEDGNF